MKSYTPPMKRPRKALQLRVFSGVKCSQPTPGISAYSRAASAALQPRRRPGNNTAAARPGEKPCRTPDRAGFPPRPPRSATFPARDRGAAPPNGNSGNKRPSSISPAYSTRVLSIEKAFHGRTSLAVEVTNNPKIIAPINANGHVTYLPINDLEAWEKELAKGDVCACIIEAIQGVGGCNMVTPEFAQGLQAACKKYGTVLICDEIQCGYGRSGKFFAHQWLGIRPDMITVAKGIGNGFPMGGVLISPEFKPVYGQLGTTFGGNHLACTAALAVLDVFEKENLVENAHVVGEYLISQLKELQKRNSHITEIRGRGLMVGVVLDIPHKEVRNKLIHEQHCFTGCAGTNILRILPPLILSKENVEDFIGRLEKVLKEV